MKKLIVTFFVLLLVPALATASTNMVSITELRQQAENMGRWTQTYEAHGRTIEVDIPIIVPEAEKLPVVEVEAYYAIRNDRLNRENYPLKRLHTYDEKEEYKNYIIYEETNLDTYLNNEKQTTGELRIVNSETGLDMADLEARYDAPTEKLTIFMRKIIQIHCKMLSMFLMALLIIFIRREMGFMWIRLRCARERVR